MSLTSAYLIQGPAIYTEQDVLKNHALHVEGGVIRAILSLDHPLPKHLPVLNFPSHYHLLPGFIDMHIHGTKGADVMDATPDSLHLISETLLKEGTTRYLATTMTETHEHIERALKNVDAVIRTPSQKPAAKIAGVHLEGPFLSVKQMGAQQGELICAPDITLFDRWQHMTHQQIRMVTLAPETMNALPFIQHLVKNKVIVSIGHTDATYEETKAGIEAGATHATHLFNAMSGLHHRRPGAVTALLLDERVSTELILDGFHLHPAIVKMTLNIKGKERVILVTDAMRAKCLGEGTFDLGGQPVHVKDDQARLTNGVLAGSVLKMNNALKHVLEWGCCSLADASMMASVNPAKQLGVFAQTGSIAVGKKAELVVLNEQYEVVETFIE